MSPLRSLRAILVIAVGCCALARSTFSSSRAAAAVQQMHAAAAPHQTCIRRISYGVTTPCGASRIVVVEARRTIGDTTHVLTVVLAPEHLRGAAFLVDESRARGGVQWIYAPAVGPVRKVVGPETHAAFLGTDFTYADLRLASRRMH